jgi:adenosine deaminase
MESFTQKLPKAELHLHIEGSLEPDLMFALAQRNNVKLRFASVEEVRAAYNFSDLQSFLDIYYEGAAVLRTERDFYDLAWAYLTRAAADNVRHVEMFFDPQTHTARGIPFTVVLDGLSAALKDAKEKWHISGGLILCFLRHLSEEDALAIWKEAAPHAARLLGVGLDSSEQGHPPKKFQRVFSAARDAGLHAVAHAGEEGPPEYISQALDLLKIERIDHGVRLLEDPQLTARVTEQGVPLTVCPLSNVKLRVFDTLEKHNLRELLQQGVCASIHSDDPAYFGGYIGDNYAQTAEALALNSAQLRTLARNSIAAAFLTEKEKTALIAEIDALKA